MSKIHTMRMINLNYNHNAIRISDETFDFHGVNTLLSLRNGGGKSVLVQMMTAPFVHKRYRDTKDRPFESYFTTGKPSLILVEWALDGGAGFALTGMVIRRNQEILEEEPEDSLEIMNFITEYKEPCEQDIHNLPVIEKTDKSYRVKSFAAIRQMFETYKKGHTMDFYYYDMGSTSQAKQYFDKLAQYQIYYKEWETIIKKINTKESGLSDLFTDCKDEKGLVERWFLDVVESKLNKNRNRIKEFQNITLKYVRQYKENVSKIQRKEGIVLFLEKADEILSDAEVLKVKTGVRKEYENQIAALIQEMTALAEKKKTEIQNIERNVQEIEENLQRVEYEEISYKIHELHKKKAYQVSNRDMVDLEREELILEREGLEQKLHIQECAKLWSEVLEAKEEYSLCEMRLQVSKKQEQELLPERNRLGIQLYLYYEAKLDEEEQVFINLENRRAAAAVMEEENRALISQYHQESEDKNRETGRLSARIESYQEAEEEFNRLYDEDLTRNILGLYEPGTIAIREEKYGREIAQCKRKARAARTKRLQLETEVNGLYREIEDRKVDLAKCLADGREAAWERKILEKEKEERLVILKYLSISEEDLFDGDNIMKMFERKLLEIGQAKRGMEKEYDEIEREYKRVTKGKVLELPEDLEEMLRIADIHYIYGMKWLKKNGRGPEENRRLVREHPLLPYALLLTEKELKRLRDLEEPIYTAVPIPILLRESLEEKSYSHGKAVVTYEGISFYIYFNESILDEEKLRAHLCKMEATLQQMEKAITEKGKEYTAFLEKKEKIRSQKLEHKSYLNLIQLQEELSAKEQTLKAQQDTSREILHKKEEEGKRLSESIAQMEQEGKDKEQRLSDFLKLKCRYEEYTQWMLKLAEVKKRLQELGEARGRSEEQLKRCHEKMEALNRERGGMVQRMEKDEEQKARYENYKPVQKEAEEGLMKNTADKTAAGHDLSRMAGACGAPPISQEDAILLEAEFKALGDRISREQEELEAAYRKAGKNYKKWQSELADKSGKHGVGKETYENALYQKQEEKALEIEMEDRQKKIERLTVQWNEANMQTRLMEQQVKAAFETMREKCHKEALVPQEKITFLDFQGRKNQHAAEKIEVCKERNQAEEKYRSYEEILTALSEYGHFKQSYRQDWNVNFEGMNRKALKDYKGALIRDYTVSKEQESAAKDQLLLKIHETARMGSFQDEYFAKPLDVLLKIIKEENEKQRFGTSDPVGKGRNNPVSEKVRSRYSENDREQNKLEIWEQVTEQLQTHSAAFRNLLEKLEVDISIIEKERDKVTETLGDYIREVHENIGKIDRNSTIRIRDKSIKMLQVRLSNWDENQGTYEIRLRDIMDEITNQGIAILEKNENVEEFLGSRVTTKYLYDRVVGMSNAKIQLFKIEEQREYPITWSDVAKNSGGEGFLSAFVILSSLLYYMRKDDSDLFADQKEGKVLIMDNPFAQTNATHLLNPLMDMAKKAHTQLICLSGLGGDSIYNCFDNIYVLNLVPSRMRSGMQYLKADRARGEEYVQQTLLSSQFQVLEQQDLLF